MVRNKFFIITVFCLFPIFPCGFAQTGHFEDLVVSDGPYLFLNDGKYVILTVKNNNLRTDTLTRENFQIYMNRYKLLFGFEDLLHNDRHKPDLRQIFRRIDSVGVISDLHGEYNKYIDLLQSAGIIDKDLNWKFGKGHLVILGDIFDRGDKVTEILWHLYGLEKQAERAGGMVHILLGNHELMVFERDLRYLSDKYKKVEAITGFCYSELFSVNSVLGGWLRSKPVLISINDIMFLHAGISLDLSLKYLEFSRINGIILKSLSGNGPVQVIDSTELDNITNSQGPVWYRGYFTDNKFTEDRLDSILNCFGKRHIIVGHTPNEHVHSYYGNKLFGIDSGLGHGEPGEMLLIKGADFYIVDRTGKRSRLINGR